MLNITDECREIIKKHITNEDVVIVAPLNWGLGHASRCIPLINLLMQTSKKVIIASDGAALELLKLEFPDLTHFKLPSYNVRYKFQSMVGNILLQFPMLLIAYFKEIKLAHQICTLTGATAIMSDNRFGFRSQGVKNYYITHQVNILHSNHLISFMASRMHQRVIRKFDLCWIPDYIKERSLAGLLSTSESLLKKEYIGPLTRIRNLHSKKVWDVCVLMSGPEPQRSLLEWMLLKVLNLLTEYKILFIRGIRDPKDFSNVPNHITIENLFTSEDISTALNTSRLLICRSGYSTLMDIEKLDIKAIFIPTPGQTEQEYLADRWSKKSCYFMIKQDQVNNLPREIKKMLN